MRYRIVHDTEYLFDSEVFLEPHTFRLRPRRTPYIKTVDTSVDIYPQPAGRSSSGDEENNRFDFCWFDGMTKSLQVRSETILETIDFNPFDFVLYPQSFNQLPVEYDESQLELLSPSLISVHISKELLEFGNKIQKACDFGTVSYLTELTRAIHNDFLVEYREEGEPFHPDESFELKRGSCRDITWMQIHLLRNQGFAARFASGYYYFNMEEPSYELHAWVEVFLPGAGWLGLDPSHGSWAGNTHFPIASSAKFENTMPVSGNIRGDASSKLVTNLLIEEVQ